MRDRLQQSRRCLAPQGRPRSRARRLRRGDPARSALPPRPTATAALSISQKRDYARAIEDYSVQIRIAPDVLAYLGARQCVSGQRAARPRRGGLRLGDPHRADRRARLAQSRPDPPVQGRQQKRRRRLRQGAAIRSGRRVLLEQPRAGADARRRQEGRDRGSAQGAGASPRARRPRCSDRRSSQTARRVRAAGTRATRDSPPSLPRHPGGGPWRSIASTISRCLRSSRSMCTATTPWIDGTRNRTGKNQPKMKQNTISMTLRIAENGCPLSSSPSGGTKAARM